jgi:RND family efflux transporter MFP subunit
MQQKSKNALRMALAGGVAVASIALLSACGAGEAEPAAPPPPQVTVAAPLTETVTDWSEFTGRFVAAQRVEVRARTGGFLQTAHFNEGQMVRKGQVLFTLDPRPAQAALKSAEADAALARRAFERAEVLIKDQAISTQEYDQRKAALDIADAAVAARRLDVEFTRVTAPASGMVSDRKVDPGNVISGGSSAADVLTTIVAVDPIHFEFDASEAQLLRYQRQALKTGGKVLIKLQDENDFRWSGTVDFSDAVVDAASGSVRMRALVANPEGFLKPGMFGRARVEGSEPYAAMLIPETAVVSQGSAKVAMVVGADGTVQAKPVETGDVVDGLRVIRSGLAANDRVIVNGLQRAMPGAPVQATDTTITRTASLDTGVVNE